MPNSTVLESDAPTEINNSNNRTEAILKIPFENPQRAEIVYRVLSVDKEPRRNFVQKELRLLDNQIEIHFKADQILLRNSLRIRNLSTIMAEHTPAPTPHRAVYGFGFYLLFFTIFILYVMWALLPTESWGLHYLPDKYFAAYLPILLLMAMFFFEFFIYPGIGLAMTPNVDDMGSVMDTTLLLRHVDVSKEPKLKNESLWTKVRWHKQFTPRKERKMLRNCSFCQGTHCLPAAHEQISTLRFLDLKEVNMMYD